MPQRLSAVIVGSGRIGAQAGLSKDTEVRTHAQALLQLNSSFELKGFVDVSEESLSRAQAKWGLPGFKSLEEYKSKLGSPQLVVIASPDEWHIRHLETTLSFEPKAIVLEKPVATRVQELEEFLSRYPELKPLIAVNYTRRYMPALYGLNEEIKDGKWGRFLHGTIHYSKGLFHSGSHLLNLVLPLFERKISQVQYLDRKTDYTAEDPSLDCVLRFEDGSYFTLQTVKSGIYELSEIDLFFEKARVRIDNLAYTISYYLPEILNPETGIRYVTRPSSTAQGSLSEAFLELYRGLPAAIQSGQEPRSSFQEAVRTFRICDALSKGCDFQRTESIL